MTSPSNGRAAVFSSCTLLRVPVIDRATRTWEEKFHVPLGTVVGRYVIHYADGQPAEVPINYGRDVRDWWHYAESAPDDPALIVAWEGSNSWSRQHGATTRLYKSTWQNPRPDVAIRSLDFVHAKTYAVPVLVAITAEPEGRKVTRVPADLAEATLIGRAGSMLPEKSLLRM